MHARSHFPGKLRYIDLMSGSGLCKIRNSEYIIAGSAAIAANTKMPFDEHHFVENDFESLTCLERRLAHTGRKIFTYCNDCNKSITEILDEVAGNDHYLAFVDKEGLDVNWNTIKLLSEFKGDIIINFQTSGIERTRGLGRDNASAKITLEEFFGDSSWLEYNSGEDLLNLYIRNLSSISDRDKVVPIHVQGSGGFRYDLILATRTTRSNTPWLKPTREIGDLFRYYGADYVKTALKIAAGTQLGLKRFT
jgi:three-Cys-motif partner protein